MIEKTWPDLLALFTTFYDLSVWRSLYSKAEMRQFGASAYEIVGNGRVKITFKKNRIPDFRPPIQSAPHQRITRYGILLSPLQKVIDHNLKEKLSIIQKEVDALCRWLNNRVKLSEIDKELVSVSYAHLKVDSEEAKSELRHQG